MECADGESKCFGIFGSFSIFLWKAVMISASGLNLMTASHHIFFSSDDTVIELPLEAEIVASLND